MTDSYNDIEKNKYIQQYVANELSNEQRNAFEKQMLDDIFLEDAVEGFEALNDKTKDNFNALGADLDERVLKLLNKKNKKNRRVIELRWFLLATALILLFAALALYIIWNSKN